MSPVALDAPEHRDSFTLPSVMPRETNNTGVHASARRSPEGGLIKVDSEDTVYQDGSIRSKFVDRGAEVTSELEIPAVAGLCARADTRQKTRMASSR